MPFQAQPIPAPPTDMLPDWLKALAATVRNFQTGEGPVPVGGHIPSLAAKAAAMMVPETAAKWANEEYAPGQPIPTGDWMPDVIGNAMGMIPGAAGMVRWGKHAYEYPTAKLHRGVGALSELDWWDKVFKRGAATEKPMTLNSPSYLSVFQSNPGLLFDIERPKQIRLATPFDMASVGGPLPVSPKYLQTLNDARTALKQKMVPPDPWFSRPPLPEPGAPPTAWKEFEAGYEKYRDLDKEYEAARTLWEIKASQLSSRIHDSWERHAPERWQAPTGLWDEIVKPEYLTRTREAISKGKTLTPADYETLTDFFTAQAANARKIPPLSEKHLSHNEIIPRVGRQSLSGVRIEPDSPLDADINRRLVEFANEYDVPVYSWPSRFTRGQQMEMMKAPLMGEWVSGPEGVLTSSEIERILAGRPPW